MLDLILPGLDGQAVLHELRRRRSMTPVLVLTARSEVEDKVRFADAGADDYLVKPFDFRELEARCRALLRRPCGMAASTVRFGNLVFDAAARRVIVAEQPVELTRREFRLLELLLANLGRVLDKDVLIDRLFGLEEAVAPTRSSFTSRGCAASSTAPRCTFARRAGWATSPKSFLGLTANSETGGGTSGVAPWLALRSSTVEISDMAGTKDKVKGALKEAAGQGDRRSAGPGGRGQDRPG